MIIILFKIKWKIANFLFAIGLANGIVANTTELTVTIEWVWEEMMTKLTDDIIYGRQALTNKEPWIVPESLEHLRGLMMPDFKVFEWGSGGSTIWFAERCKELVSVDDHKKWFDIVLGWIRERDLRNVDLKFLPGKPWHKYADAILEYPEAHFDLVFVDGRRSVRARCIENALIRIKPGGTLLIDNSNWLDSFPSFTSHSAYDIWTWDRVDYRAPDHKWLGQPNDWWTSLFTKPV